MISRWKLIRGEVRSYCGLTVSKVVTMKVTMSEGVVQSSGGGQRSREREEEKGRIQKPFWCLHSAFL